MIIKNARLFDSGRLVNIKILDGVIAKISEEYIFDADCAELDAGADIIAPGFIDLHVHLRDPGLIYKEDIKTGTLAAINGGFTSICAMPNTVPVTDTPEIIKYILDSPASCRVLPVAAITKAQEGKELTDFHALKRAGAISLSDDGKTVESAELMREALVKSRENNILIISHCEPEDEITRRDINLASDTGARLHIAHVSTANSVQAIADAKKSGLKITAETCPHYFSLTEQAVLKSGADAKMNPPLRTHADRTAIIDAIKSGVIDCISTDHAPHSPEDKMNGANGITGLETAFALGVTCLVRENHITLEKLIKLMSLNPAKIIGLDDKLGSIEEGKTADLVIFNIDERFIYDKNSSRSKSRNTPFHGFELYGRILYTICGGKLV